IGLEPVLMMWLVPAVILLLTPPTRQIAAAVKLAGSAAFLAAAFLIGWLAGGGSSTRSDAWTFTLKNLSQSYDAEFGFNRGGFAFQPAASGGEQAVRVQAFAAEQGEQVLKYTTKGAQDFGRYGLRYAQSIWRVFPADVVLRWSSSIIENLQRPVVRGGVPAKLIEAQVRFAQRAVRGFERRGTSTAILSFLIVSAISPRLAVWLLIAIIYLAGSISARRETSDVVSLALARWWLFFALVEWIAAAARRWRGGLPVLGSATWRTALIRMSLTTVGAVLAFAAVLTGARAIQSRNVAGVVRAYHDAPRDTLDVVRLIDGDVESVRLPADVLARDDDERSGEDTASVTLLAADLDAGACGEADLPLSV